MLLTEDKGNRHQKTKSRLGAFMFLSIREDAGNIASDEVGKAGKGSPMDSAAFNPSLRQSETAAEGPPLNSD